MATNKMTNKKALAVAVSVMTNLQANPATDTITIDGVSYPVSDIVEKLEGMLTALDNKTASAKRKPTEKQKENANLRGAILRYLATAEKPMTCTEIGKAMPELEGMNNQRISALMRSLVEDGRVSKTTEKGKSLFAIIKGGE